MSSRISLLLFCTMILPLGVIFLVLDPAIALAGTNDATSELWQLRVEDGHSGTLTGRPLSIFKAFTDTIYLMGGSADPDHGDFEGEDGECSWDGWTSHDLTIVTTSNWHCDDYNCQNLDPGTVPNHAWWCGRYWQDDCATGDLGGYGNLWHEYLAWYGTVPNPSLSTQVRITAMLNYDVEPDYDYLYLQYETLNQGWVTVAVYNGAATDVAVDETFTVSQADYVGPGEDQIHLRWRFTSDIAWSDEDCNWPTMGAAQVDLIDVFFDQGGGNVQMGTTEDCEGPSQWVPEFPDGVGDFAYVWPFLSDIDPCRSNATCQVAFIDHPDVGISGGYGCTTWCYGPGGYIVNPEGGLAGPDFHLHNAIWSEVMAWPVGDYDGATFEFEVFRHEEFSLTSAGVFYVWYVRSTDSNDPADISQAEWDNDGYIYYGGPDYRRHSHDVTGLMVPGRKYVQISLGAWELGFGWGVDGTDGTPAPYFDNVMLRVYAFGGPAIRTREIDIFQDNFPEIGIVDYNNLGANSVRVDGAMTYWGTPIAVDTITCDIVAVRTGSILEDMPKLYYKLFPNSLFDPVRTSSLPNQGWVYGDSTRTVGGVVVPDRFTFDLPDTGFFFPGDRLHYYIEAKDNASGDIGVTTLPPDTTGFSLAPGMSGYVPLAYPSSYVVRALPKVFTSTEGDHPKILLWNDFGNRGGEDEWTCALNNIGYREGTDYDLYYTNGPSTGLSNGLGGRATATQLIGYDVILYTAGDLYALTIMTRDAEVLDSWLRSTGGGKSMLLTGDNLLYDLVTGDDETTLLFANNWIGANLADQDLRPLIESQVAPVVRTLPGNSVFNAINEWMAYGGCPDIATFDAVLAQASVEPLAEFLGPTGEGGQYPYAAATLKYNATYDAKIVYLPYDFMSISSEASSGGGDEVIPARAQVLQEVLFYFGQIGSSPTVPVPEAGQFTVASYPNPFNPSTKIEFNLPRRGELRLRIYNVRGELVRTLLDEVRPAGAGHVMWDGSDDGGRAVASGVYFLETRIPTEVRISKLALVR